MKTKFSLVTGEEVEIEVNFTHNGRHVNDPEFAEFIEEKVWVDGQEVRGAVKEEMLNLALL